MNDFQKHIPQYWVRFQTRFMKIILETTIRLLSIGGHGGMTVQPSQYITPIHYLALLDPMAEWFKHWTVSITGKQWGGGGCNRDIQSNPSKGILKILF